MDTNDKDSLDNLSQPQDTNLLHRLLASAGQGIAGGFERFRGGVSGQVTPTQAQRMGMPQAQGLTMAQVQAMLEQQSGQQNLSLRRQELADPLKKQLIQSQIDANEGRSDMYSQASGLKGSQGARANYLLKRQQELDRQLDPAGSGLILKSQDPTTFDQLNAESERNRQELQKLLKTTQSGSASAKGKQKSKSSIPDRPDNVPTDYIYVLDTKTGQKGWHNPNKLSPTMIKL